MSVSTQLANAKLALDNATMMLQQVECLRMGLVDFIHKAETDIHALEQKAKEAKKEEAKKLSIEDFLAQLCPGAPSLAREVQQISLSFLTDLTVEAKDPILTDKKGAEQYAYDVSYRWEEKPYRAKMAYFDTTKRVVEWVVRDETGQVSMLFDRMYPSIQAWQRTNDENTHIQMLKLIKPACLLPVFLIIANNVVPASTPKSVL